MSLSNHDLIKIARASNIPLDAVLNKDQLGQVPTEWAGRSFSLVINLMDLFDGDRNQLPGSHWVGLYYDPRNGFAYFDSYGFIPPVEVYNMANRLKPGAQFLWSDKMIQRVNTETCGYYTLYFLYAMTKSRDGLKKKFSAFQNEFGDPLQNTKRLDKLLKRHWPVRQSRG